jgi:hypothetical protein
MNKLHQQDMSCFWGGLGDKKANASTQSLIFKDDLQEATC